MSINKYLSPDEFKILEEIDISHSGELICQNDSWWIDEKIVNDKEAIKNLYLMRLIKPIKSSKDEQIYKLNEDGLGCLSDKNYTPKLLQI